MHPDLLAAWHWLTTAGNGAGFDALFSSIRHSTRPSDAEAEDAVRALLAGNSCRTRAGEVASSAGAHGWALAYALAWLSVSGVRRQLFLPVDDNYSCRFTSCALRCCATLVR